MDQKGFIFTFDAVLALIPLVLMMVLISNLPVSGDSPSQLTISQDAQDYLNVLASSQIKDGKVMDWMVQALKTGNNDGVEEAGKLAKPILDNLTSGRSYQLLETGQLNNTILISQGNLNTSTIVGSGTLCWENFIFVLYVGQ
ncbi:MAG: hypothetical protein QM405_06500 [Euryarchaeota archaeon]|nr:hypothetical protein [Euryarchaeota archaeon]HNS25511.1 hypothetical protein [Methanobacteriaceae archaeon]